MLHRKIRTKLAVFAHKTDKIDSFMGIHRKNDQLILVRHYICGFIALE